MHILVTNDDGVFAPGLLALVQALRALGRVSVLAPDRNWSASGHVKTLHRPLRVNEVKLADGSPALASDGAPSDCVALALMGLVEKPIDLVVSGINPYANLGHDLTYSGTVTAAMEAVIAGVPGLAVSLDGSEEHPVSDYGPAAQVACKDSRDGDGTTAGCPPTSCSTSTCRPCRRTASAAIASPARGRASTATSCCARRPARPAVLLDRRRAAHRRARAGTDVGDLAAGWVSITPVSLDLTAAGIIDEMKGWI